MALLSVIAKHKAVSEEMFLDSRHCAQHEWIVARKESEVRNHQYAGVESLAPVRLRKGAYL